MKQIALGTTGERVSHLALGCMLMGTTTDEATATRILDEYVAAGGGFLDTANCYAWWARRGSLGGESEEVLGRWLSRPGRRDQVFLATKGTAMVGDLDPVWGERDEPDWDLARARFEGAGARALREALDGSLRRLATDHIDLYYVHVDDRATPLEETLETLAGFVQAGKVRHLGWSNVRTWRLERIRRLCEQHGWPAPVALQQQHSYLRRRAGLDNASIVDDEQLDYLRTNPEVTLVAYSPILKGVFDDPAKPSAPWVLEPYAGRDADARLAVLGEVASEIGCAPTQVVLAWLLHQSAPPVVPLVGPRTLEQFRSAMAALDVRLTPDQVTRLDLAGA